MSEVLSHYTNEFRSGRDVSPYDAEAVFNELITSSDVDGLTELLSAWATKGTTEDELYRFAKIMRGRMKTLVHGYDAVTDIVGTGGSRAKTFNVSTAAAFVIAGAGIPVAKHGNRAATSSSGSADVLSLLGINVDVEPTETERHLSDHGICFMFAPRFHSLSPTLAVARRGLASPTIFNNLGPLCNPASAANQVIGVWDDKLLRKTARTLQLLGTSRSWVVNGEGGLDEIGLGTTRVAEINNGNIKEFNVTAADFGLDRFDGDLPSNCSAEQSAETIKLILGNELKERDAERLVLINAAAAIYVSGLSDSLSGAYKIAEESVRSGAASTKFRSLVAENQ